MNTSTEYATQRELQVGEKLLWSGRPRTGIRFETGDLVAVPFSLMWFGFAIFWESMAFTGHAPTFFLLWGIPFLAIGAYMLAGRFVFDAWRRGRTIYAVTD